jgi:hypothetical protein
MGPGWNHVVRGGRVIKTTIPSSPSPVTQIPPRIEVATTSKQGATTKPAPKVKVGPKKALATNTNKHAKPAQPLHTTPKDLVAPTVPSISPIEEISDLLDNLPLTACVELTRRLLTSIPTLPSGPARTRAVLKIVILFVAEYGSTA